MLIYRLSYLPTLFTIALSVLTVLCFSQERHAPVENSFSLSGGAGVMLAKVIDEQFSSAVYSGLAPVGALNLGYQKDKQLHHLALSFSKGVLDNEQLVDYSMNLQNFSARYSYGINLGNTDTDWENFIGASLAYLRNKRVYSGYINKTAGGEKTFSLGLMAQSGYHFGATKDWRLLARLNLPFLSAVSLDDPGINELESGKLVFIPRLLVISTGVQLERRISGNGTLVLGYIWDAYKLDYQLAIKQVSHKILLSYQINF